MINSARAILDRYPSTVRVVLAMVAALILALFLDGGTGAFLTVGTVGSVLQYCATLGLVAVGLGIVMTVGELDLSVGAMAGVAGVIAVRAGGGSALVGLILAMLFGLVFGLLQGLVVTRLRISSVAVTLGGLLLLQGLASELTSNSTLTFGNAGVTTLLNRALGPIFTVRSIIVVAIVLVLGAVLATTRIGRDLRAAGSQRRGARVAGVRTDLFVTAAMGCSGLFSALGGVLLSYNLGAASATSLSDLLVPSLAAAILGGVKLSGGRGNPIGVLIGVATLGVLQSGLTAAGQPTQVQQLYVGILLTIVALTESPRAKQRIQALTAWRHRVPKPALSPEAT